MTAVPPPTDLAAWLTGLEAARAAATPGEWRHRDGLYGGARRNPIKIDADGLIGVADAAAIVAEHNAIGPLIQAVREFAELEAGYPLGTDVPVYRLHRILAALTPERTTP